MNLAIGIPDSTVRRKVAVLVARGWIALLPDRTYLVTDAPQVEFATLNLATWPASSPPR